MNKMSQARVNSNMNMKFVNTSLVGNKQTKSK